MAEEVVIKVTVAGEDRVLKSMKDIKKAKKDLAEASVFGDKQAAKALADLNDKLEETGDAVKTLKGSGIEKVTGSFGQLGEGFRNLDFDKIKTGFKGLGAAMKAVPIFLIVEGIMYLVQNFNELSKGSGVLAKALSFVGDILSAISDGLTWLTDNLGWTNSALEEMGDKAVEMADKSKDAIAAQSAEYDRLAKEAKMSGQSAVKYEVAKQQAIIDTNVAILKQLLAYKDAGGEFTEEQQKLLTTSTAALKAATTERKLILFNEAEDKKKKDKEVYDNWEALEKKKVQDWVKLDKELSDAKLAGAEIDKENRKLIADDIALDAKAVSDAAQKLADDDYENSKKLQEKKVEDNKKANQEQLEADKLYEQQKLQSRQDAFNAAKGLSDLFFMNELNNAKGNAKATMEIKKRQFQVDKAFRVAQAIQDGIAATLKAIANGGGVPTGIPFGIATGALAAVNVAKILATKFEGGSVADIGVPSAGVVTNAPNVNTTAPTTQAAQTTTTTKLGEDGQNMGQRVYVLESDISKSQNRVARLNEQATV